MKTPDFWRLPDSKLSLALLPFAWAYGIGAALDRHFKKPQRAPIRVLSIGNVTAGGAGKTPVALALAPMLAELGAIPHFITRGYGSIAPLNAHRVTDSDTAAIVGDEALLLTRVAPTWVGANRLASAIAASQAGATLAVCDDALQHHALEKNLSLLVIDGPYGLGNGRLIPAGPLREPFAEALARCDAIILIGDDRQQLAERSALPIFHADVHPAIDIEPLRADRWLAFAGLARPQKFFDSLDALGLHVVATRAFADHYPYSPRDLADLRAEAFDRGARLITTAKDAVKIPSTATDITTLPIALTFRDPQAVRSFLHTSLATSA